MRRGGGEPGDEDWPAVAAAIDQRLDELGLCQIDLIRRSQVSKAVVGEIRHNVRRRRSPRTLAALSIALNWHPQHLEAVLSGHRPPRTVEPVELDANVAVRLASIERCLRQTGDRLGATIEAMQGQLDQIGADLSSMIRRSGNRDVTE
jgi:hypothetical protein